MAAAVHFSAIPAPPPPRTLAEYYNDAANDPYQGNYEAVMREFHNLDVPPTAATVFSLIQATGQDAPYCYIGIYETPNEECGCSLALSGIDRYTTPMGRRDVWSNCTFAFVGDVVDSEIPSIEFLGNNCAQTNGAATTKFWERKLR
jgi:hypothetical protein